MPCWGSTSCCWVPNSPTSNASTSHWLAVRGGSCSRAIRALPGGAGRVPIIAMTANARAEDRRACLDAGMDDYVAKPIDTQTVAAAIQGVTGAGPRAAPTAAAAAKSPEVATEAREGDL